MFGLLLATIAAFPVDPGTPRRHPGKAPTPAPRSEERVALVGGVVHTMVRGEAPRVATILIEGGRIAAVGELELPPGTVRRELSGQHVVPGLIDGYVNFDPEHDALYLAAGITTVRDVGGDHVVLLQEREREARERVPGPALITPGALLDGDPPASARAVVLRNAQAAEGYLPILFEEDVDFLSVFLGLPEDAWRRSIELAHEHDLQVWGPVPRAVDLARALRVGQDGFHFLDTLLPPDFDWESGELPALDERIATLARSHRPLVPLLQASALRLRNQGADEDLLKLFGLLAPSYETWWKTELTGRCEVMTEQRLETGRRVVEKQARLLERLQQAGVPLLPGSGAPQPWLFPGQALHQELAQWVSAGIPRHEVLELATRGAAEALGISGQRGTIVPGAIADLVVVEGDPSQDLARLIDPELVVIRGRVLERSDLAERLATLARDQARVREELARPVSIEPPPTPAEGVVILEGSVESELFGTRVSSERYRVARLPGDVLLYSGRVLYPPSGSEPGREMTIQQSVRAGELEQVQVTLSGGKAVLEFRGLWTANTWRMQSLLDGKLLANAKPLHEHPVCVEVSSVTALLILGQNPPGEREPVLHLHPGLEAELVAWRVELDDRGDHQIRTNLGRKAFRLNAQGALEFAMTQVGQSTLRTRLLSFDAFGGPGLPLPEGKRSSATAPGSSGSDGGQR